MSIGQRIVMIGDSITEEGRFEDQEKIGDGYVRLIHDYLQVTEPDRGYQVINKGVGGDRVTDLKSRWQQDVIELQPDTVSISIGINDVWRQLDQPHIEQVFPDQFEAIYQQLIEQVYERTNAHIILMEPTVIEENIQSEGNQRLKDYVDIVRKLARTHQATLVPTHQVFLTYLTSQSTYPLTTDGVHMNPAGNMLMAKTWLETVR
ncbi:hydrolase [Gracilibacillus halophilus YIM-C55.5]|uniref:Hydrolase n=1 Tax=Gracilibacillus halophilus YIM-C55.5 TaxID=1308866 RepID=N4W824_9BACI|nr:SGNH/GDSL hydrolase family protein [Gracilibacillus halophilus]ENH96423.1 hydrolase [Gracilibacillus halophilus YIM-C55.5]